MWCHGTVAELLGEAALCRCARMPDAAYVQVTERFWREAVVSLQPYGRVGPKGVIQRGPALSLFCLRNRISSSSSDRGFPAIGMSKRLSTPNTFASQFCHSFQPATSL